MFQCARFVRIGSNRGLGIGKRAEYRFLVERRRAGLVAPASKALGLEQGFLDFRGRVAVIDRELGELVALVVVPGRGLEGEVDELNRDVGDRGHARER